MKTVNMLTILVLALAQVSNAAQSLTVNGEVLDSITLKTGQTCSVEVVSDNSNPYTAYVGFDDRVVLGSFDQPLAMPEAGDLASITEYDVPSFYGYFVSAAGTSPPPSPGVHFTIQYQPQQVGETELKLYDPTRMTVIMKMHITVVAARMGTVFTYQGRLMEADNPADGQHDFEFRLYNAPSYGSQLSGTVDVNDLDVIDGYFTVELDFGSNVFDGDARWLQISVRPGDSNDPNAFVSLSPRQKITTTPYSLQTRGIFVDKSENIGMGTTTPKGKLHVDGGKANIGSRGTDITIEAQDGGDGGGLMGDNGGHGGNIILQPGAGGEPRGFGIPGRPGKVGIGTDKPNATLDVRGSIKITGGSPDSGKVLTSDASGLASWESLTVLGDGDWTVSGSDMYSIPSGKVGIGTTSPAAKMEVADGSMNGKLSYHYDTGFPEGITHYSGAKGTYGAVVAGHLGYRYQVLNFNPIYYGVHGSATTNGNNVGVYGSASGGTSNWAGYFNGDLYAGGKVGIGTANPQADLDIKHKEGSYRVIQVTASDGSELFNVGEHPLGNGYLVIMDGDGTSKVLITANGNSYFDGGNVAVGSTYPQAKLDVDGDLKVSGAYKGDIGPNNGAPFPRPAYDSGWVLLSHGAGGVTLTHNVGGNVDNYVVDVQTRGGMGIHNFKWGSDQDGSDKMGFYYRDLTISSIHLHRFDEDQWSDQVRVRIWVYK